MYKPVALVVVDICEFAFDCSITVCRLLPKDFLQLIRFICG